jgi:hypothetical protein
MTTAATALLTTAYKDLGAGPLIVQAMGLCKVATGPSTPTPDLTAAGVSLGKGEKLPILATDHFYAMALGNPTTIVAMIDQ